MQKFFYAIGSVVTFLLLYYAAAALISIIFIAYYLSHGFSLSENVLFNTLSREQGYNIVILSFLLLIAFYLLFYKIKKRRVSELIQAESVVPASIIFSIITGFSFYLMARFYLSFSLGDVQTLNINISPAFDGTASTKNLTIYIITALVILPILEEITHRGILFGILKRKLNLGWALIVQGIVYALMYSKSYAILYTLVLGIIVGVVYQWHRSILLPICIHLSFNAAALLFSAVNMGKLYDTYDSIFFITGAIIFSLALIFLYWISIRTKRKPHFSVVKKVQA